MARQLRNDPVKKMLVFLSAVIIVSGVCTVVYFFKQYIRVNVQVKGMA